MKSTLQCADGIVRAIAIHGEVAVYFDPSGELTSRPLADARTVNLIAAAKSARRFVGIFGPGASASALCAAARG